MKITVACPRCEEEYTLDEEKIPEKGGKITCRRCGFIIRMKKQGLKEEAKKLQTAEDTLTFAVECPMCKHTFEVSPPPVPSEQDSDKKTILLIADENFFASFTKEILEKKYNVVQAVTVRETVTALKKVPVDIMLLDLKLKDNAAKEILTKIKKKCPVIIFAAKDSMELSGNSWYELRKLGVDDVVYKSMNLEDELFHKVEHLLP